MAFDVQSLSDIVGGRLRLADLPPLGGMWEPLGRFVTRMDRICEGDVLLATGTTSAANPAFASEAYQRGALGVVSATTPVEPWAGRFSIHVEDMDWAVWKLARVARTEFPGRVIAVAGPIGKSITCAMIEAVLGGDTCAPWREETSSDAQLTEQLLDLDDDKAYAIVEMHGATPSELDAAANLCCADIAVIVNPKLAAGGARPFAELGPWEELAATVPDNGAAIAGPVLNPRALASAGPTLQTFGRNGECDAAVSHVFCEPALLSFVVEGQVARVKAWGRHYLESALAAWCVGREAGIAEDVIAWRLGQAAIPPGRCEPIDRGEVQFIDNTASRSPLARASALELLATASDAKRRVAVVGGWPGKDADCAQASGELLNIAGADFLIATGPAAEALIDSAVEAGMRRDHCRRCADSDALLEELPDILTFGDIVLLSDIDAQAAQGVLALFPNTTPAVQPIRRAA